MLSNEDREAKASVWLERLQEAAAGKVSLVEYCRRHGLRPGEAYQWKRNLRAAGRWPALSGKHESINGGREDGTTRICARTHCRGAERGIGAAASAIASGERPSSRTSVE